MASSDDEDDDRELDLSTERPAPIRRDDLVERTEHLDVAWNAGVVGARLATSVRGGLLPLAEIFVLRLGTGADALLAWWICHNEGAPIALSLTLPLAVAVAGSAAAQRYLIRRSADLTTRRSTTPPEGESPC